MMIATMAARSQASRPGRTCRWKSASAAVSVTLGSMTTIDRSGSLAIAFNVVRARGIPWLMYGFLPTKNATSQESNSPRTGAPNISPLTQISPPFSCAIADDRYLPPNALNDAEPYDPPRWFPCPPPP